MASNPDEWWVADEVITPAPPAGGNVFVPVRPDPAKAAREDRAESAEARAARAEARAAEAAGRSATKDELAIIKAERELAGGPAAQATEGERKNAAFLTRAIGANDTYGALEIGPRSYVGEIVYENAPGLLNQLPAAIGNSPERQQADAAQLEFISAILRADSGAAIPINEIESAKKLYFPVAGDGPEVIAQKAEARARAIEGLRNAAGRLAPSALEGQSENSPAITGGGETYLTPRDLEAQSRLREAYKAGASLGDLQAIAEEYGTTFPIATQEALDAARKQGRQIDVTPSGRRSEVQNTLGAMADTGAGAYAIGAANALMSGTMDELAPLLGLDAATVQGAKEVLRDRYPAASMAGEISGQAMQMAMAGGAGSGLGVGARGLAGMEIAQGAAYGAGESNDNRLGGAALGGAGAIAGQQISKRLLEPAGQAIIQRLSRETGAPVEEVQRVITEAVEAAKPVDNVAAPANAAAVEEVATVARQALRPGPLGTRAKRKLAEMAKVDPEAQAAAERLGVDLPVDVLSDDAQLKSLAGLGRSQVGSEAESAWVQTVDQVARAADDAFAKAEASPDIAQISDDVFANLNSTMQSLERQGAALRREVDDAIDIRARVPADKTRGTINEVIADLGGGAEGQSALSSEEKRLLSMFQGEQGPTYARLNQVRDQIGQALYKGQGPWVDTSQANLKKYYGALADDQLAHVEAVGGTELADKFRGSNTLFKKMFDQRDDMVALFGKDLDKSIAPLLNRAITSGSKGDIATLNKVLSKVPSDMQGPVLASALLSQSTARTGRTGGFSFNEYAKTYRGMRKNAPVYAKFAKAVGPDAEKLFTDLYAVSRRMADADANILRTGKANQAALNALTAENFLGTVMKTAAGRTAATTAGAVAGGPVGAGLVAATQELIERGGKNATDKVHTLLSSADFKNMVEKVADGTLTPTDQKRFLLSKPFNAFAKFAKIKTPEERQRWLESALTVTAVDPQADSMTTIEIR